MITGFLTKESPLRTVFPKGMVPLTIPTARTVRLGSDELPRVEKVYFLAVKACTVEQLEGMAQVMSSLGQGTVEESRKHLGSVDEIPIRAFNISGVGMPLRNFI